LLVSVKPQAGKPGACRTCRDHRRCPWACGDALQSAFTQISTRYSHWRTASRCGFQRR